MNLEEIKSKYSEPHRHYHNWDHIEYMFQIAKENNIEIPENSALYYAILYHDIVYDPKSKTNEYDSTIVYKIDYDEYCRDTRKHLGTPFVTFASGYWQLVIKLILVTEKHSLENLKFPFNDFKEIELAKTLIDLDLSSLAKPWNEYVLDRSNIRKEYSHLTHEEFHNGRLEWIEGMLSRDNIFYTDWGKKLEKQARENLEFDEIWCMGELTRDEN